MPAKLAEKRQIRMHSALIFDIIFRQAGTLQKAILEGVMNSVDAGAKRCDITIDEKFVTITDDGRGFRTKQEIEDWFEQVGNPHTDEEKAEKTYGRFRMGRCQLFAYGINVWDTNKFRMEVDAKVRGIEYELSASTAGVRGCRVQVELYDQLIPSTIAYAVRGVAEQVKWCPIPITINGEPASAMPGTGKWKVTDADAWYGFSDSQELRVYNQGIFVTSYPRSRFGVGGEVVSKPALDVNFARNDLMSSCSIWQRIQKVLKEHGFDSAKTKKTLDDAERTSLLQSATVGELSFEQWRKLSLFKAATGRNYAFQGILRHSNKLSFAPRGDRLADKVHRGGLAFVLDIQQLRDTGLDATGFVNWMNTLDEERGRTRFRYVPFSELKQGLNDKYEMLPKSEWRGNELLWLRLIGTATQSGIERIVAFEVHKQDWQSRNRRREELTRKLIMGQAVDTVQAWTDGASYVAFNREFLKTVEFNVEGFAAVGHVMLHELAHDGPDHCNHDHDQAFYERYHDWAPEFAGEFAASCVRNLERAVRDEGKKLTVAQLRTLDAGVRMDRTRDKLDELQEAACSNSET